MLQSFFRSVTGRMQKNEAKLERGVVSDAKTPVGRNAPSRVHQVAGDNGKQVIDLLRAGLTRAQPAVLCPLL